MSDIQKLHAEMQQLNKRKEQRQKQADDDDIRRNAIKMEVAKAALRAVIGRPMAMKAQDSIFHGCHPAIRGKLGTLKKVNRTRCDIDFDGESWACEIKHVLIIGDEPYAIACKAAGLNPDGGYPNG